MPNATCMHPFTLGYRTGLTAMFCAMMLFASSVAAQDSPSDRLSLGELQASPTGSSAEKIDFEVVGRIRDAALNHSQIMEMVGELSDLNGPRLTGSPGLKRAEEYARDKLLEWGLADAR